MPRAQLKTSPFPPGTVVSAYRTLDQVAKELVRGQSPPDGAVRATATVATDSSLTFLNLDRGFYIASAQVSGQWVRASFTSGLSVEATGSEAQENEILTGRWNFHNGVESGVGDEVSATLGGGSRPVVQARFVAGSGDEPRYPGGSVVKIEHTIEGPDAPGTNDTNTNALWVAALGTEDSATTTVGILVTAISQAAEIDAPPAAATNTDAMPFIARAHSHGDGSLACAVTANGITYHPYGRTSGAEIHSTNNSGQASGWEPVVIRNLPYLDANGYPTGNAQWLDALGHPTHVDTGVPNPDYLASPAANPKYNPADPDYDEEVVSPVHHAGPYSLVPDMKGIFLIAGGNANSAVAMAISRTGGVDEFFDYGLYIQETDPVRIATLRDDGAAATSLLIAGDHNNALVSEERAGPLVKLGAAVSDAALRVKLTPDTNNRVLVTAGGQVKFGSGLAAENARLRWTADRTLTLDDAAGGNAILALNDAQLIPGTGSPEGVVAAARGSLFLRLDGGATTTLYVKTSGGAGINTGWTAK